MKRQGASQRSSSINLQGPPLNQRDHLKIMVVKRLQQDYAEGKQLNTTLIQFYVDDFFQRNKLSDAGIKAMKDEILIQLKKPDHEKKLILKKLNELRASQQLMSQSSVNLPDTQQVVRVNQSEQLINQIIVSTPQQNTPPNYNSPQTVEEIKSVYGVKNPDQDEWTALILNDYEQFQKEKQLKAILQRQQKEQTRKDLDKQLIAKRERIRAESLEQEKFVKMNESQIIQDINKQREQEYLLKEKLLHEKQMRDQQIKEEKLRRRLELDQVRKSEDQMVRKIREEIEQENVQLRLKRQTEREKFQEIIKKNEEYKKQAIEYRMLERDQENRQQEEYLQQLKLIDEKREKEARQREERIKLFMSNFDQTTGNNHKIQQQQDDRNYINRVVMESTAEVEQEKAKKAKLQLKNSLLKSELDRQVEEKERMRKEELKHNQRYIEQVLKQDEEHRRQESIEREAKKRVNLHHAYSLQSQMKYRVGSERRMNNVELLQNKSLLKSIEKSGVQLPVEITRSPSKN